MVSTANPMTHRRVGTTRQDLGGYGKTMRWEGEQYHDESCSRGSNSTSGITDELEWSTPLIVIPVSSVFIVEVEIRNSLFFGCEILRFFLPSEFIQVPFITFFAVAFVLEPLGVVLELR